MLETSKSNLDTPSHFPDSSKQLLSFPISTTVLLRNRSLCKPFLIIKQAIRIFAQRLSVMPDRTSGKPPYMSIMQGTLMGQLTGHLKMLQELGVPLVVGNTLYRDSRLCELRLRWLPHLDDHFPGPCGGVWCFPCHLQRVWICVWFGQRMDWDN